MVLDDRDNSSTRGFSSFILCENDRKDETTEMSRGGPVDQWTSGPVDQWTSGSVDQWTSGPVDQWTSGPVDQWTSGSVDQWTSGPVDQWISGPVDQWTSGPVDQRISGPVDQRISGPVELGFYRLDVSLLLQQHCLQFTASGTQNPLVDKHRSLTHQSCWVK